MPLFIAFLWVFVYSISMAREKDTIAASDEHNSRGIELADRGWLDEAVKEFKKAIELDPNSAHAHDNLATVFAEKKQFRGALDEYLVALRLEPDSATAHYNLACFLSAHAIDFAISEYREAIELEPDYPDAHLNLGLTLADVDRNEEATQELKRAVELDGSDPLPRHELAGLEMDLGDYRSAITERTRRRGSTPRQSVPTSRPRRSRVTTCSSPTTWVRCTPSGAAPRTPSAT